MFQSEGLHINPMVWCYFYKVYDRIIQEFNKNIFDVNNLLENLKRIKYATLEKHKKFFLSLTSKSSHMLKWIFAESLDQKEENCALVLFTKRWVFFSMEYNHFINWILTQFEWPKHSNWQWNWWLLRVFSFSQEKRLILFIGETDVPDALSQLTTKVEGLECFSSSQ